LPPANDTRAPIDGGCQPVERDQHAAFFSASLYFHHRGHRVGGRHGAGRAVS